MKKLLMIFAMLGLVFQLAACKAKKAQDDMDLVDNADVEKIEAEDASLATNSSTEIEPVDESLQAALGETSSPTEIEADPALAGSDTTITSSETQPDVAAAPAFDENSLLNDVPAPETSVADSTLTTDPGLTLDATDTSMSATDSSVAQPITETPITDSSSTLVEASSSYTEPPVAKKSSSSSSSYVASSYTENKPAATSATLKKIAETTPYQMGDTWVNTVYIARPGESLADISQKIYGSDRTKELKKINSFIKSRSPKGGDKIYYSSPNRPTDSSHMASFYEDTGMVAEAYVAHKGDNLKKVAKTLLGYDGAWKEIWTTNPVVSKAKLDEGETLRYWRSASSVSTPNVAMNTPAPEAAQIIESPNEMQLPPPPPMPEPQQMAEMPPPMQDPAMPPPPPMPEPDHMASAELPPPPPMPEPDHMAAAGETASLPDMNTPEAPKKKIVNPNMEDEAATESASTDTMMMLGGVIVLCALLAFALIRRNKKKKEAEMAMAETNIGIGT